MRRARMVINPIPWARGGWSQLHEAINMLDDAGIQLDVCFTKITEAMTQSVRHAVEQGYDLVIAGGGDGTVSEVAAGLVGTGIPLGILPVGTFNNIAHSLHLPFDLPMAARNIAQGKTCDIDVGSANGVYFFEAVGVGLDASLFPIGEEIKGGHYERLLEGAVRFLRYRKMEITLLIDGNELRLESPMVVIANGPYYGAGFTIAPQADMTDGVFDVITFECTRTEVARHFALAAQHREHQEPCLSRLQGTEIEVLSLVPLPAHADGKPLGTGRVAIRVLPRALRVIVP